MDSGQREALLRNVRAGLDVEAAAVKLDISMAEVRRAGQKLQRELADAFSTASARLRAKLLEGALDGNDMKLLATILESRERAPADAAAESELTQIQIHIVDSACPNCGHRAKANGADAARGPLNPTADRGNGLDDADQPEPEPAKPAKQPYERRYKPWIRLGGI